MQSLPILRLNPSDRPRFLRLPGLIESMSGFSLAALVGSDVVLNGLEATSTFAAALESLGLIPSPAPAAA